MSSIGLFSPHDASRTRVIDRSSASMHYSLSRLAIPWRACIPITADRITTDITSSVHLACLAYRFPHHHPRYPT